MVLQKKGWNGEMEEQRLWDIEKRKKQMAGINPTISTVILNMNGLNNTTKRLSR